MAVGDPLPSIPEIIRKKRDGVPLTRTDIYRVVHGHMAGKVPDYQAGALLMAIFFRGMTESETHQLTSALVDSGQRVDLSAIPGPVADKHSTGGVGDKTTLVVAPLVAAAGVPVAKLSGRGLGHTGGTLDKLESVPGLNVNLALPEFAGQVERIGLAIAGQTADLVPADGKLYALRDVTATVDSIPLIAASVMSKKIAGGARVVVLDVKCGRGAFMPDVASAGGLAAVMARIGEAAGLRVAAVISGMDQPLGRAVGNALEVLEALDALEGGGPPDLREICLELGAQILVLAGKEGNLAAAKARLSALLAAGAAREKLLEMVRAQGGDAAALDERRLPGAPVVEVFRAEAAGYVSRVDALTIGQAAAVLGAGRVARGEPVDHAVGMVLNTKVGDPVSGGDPLAFIHARSRAAAAEAAQRLCDAFHVSSEPPEAQPLIREIIAPYAS